MKEIFVVAAKRTPFGRYRGCLSNYNAIDLGEIALKASLKSIGLATDQLDALFMGNVLAAGLGQNMARQIALNTGMTADSSSVTINEVCGSSLKALRLAQGQIELGDFGLVAVGGSESMTNAAMFAADKMAPVQSTMLNDGLMDAFSGAHMGLTAENVAEKYQISRDKMDAYSLKSHQKAVHAQAAGYFKDEIIEMTINGKTILQDENIRPDTNLAALGKLRPAFKANGQVTAGNSSPLSDGASMLILATTDKVKELGLHPLARLAAFAESGTDPAYMGFAPYYAIKQLLKKTQRPLNDYDVVEINEAFAAPSVALLEALAISPEKLNVAGGAIAIGHPLAATGTRLITTAINALKHKNGQRALISLCIGGGQAIACELQRVD